MLWAGGDNSVYSQVNLKKEVRILNKRVSRTFLVVEVEINPTTFELVKKHRNSKEFKNEHAVQQLLDFAEYRGPAFGYVSYAFDYEYSGVDVLAEAEMVLENTQEVIIRMHKFVIDKYL